MDRFHIIGDVYAGSGDCGCGASPGDTQINSSCNSACASNSGIVDAFDVGIDINFSCSSNSNCQGPVGGCACNSAGGQCNSGSGGGSGNSGSGSCNSGGKL